MNPGLTPEFRLFKWLSHLFSTVVLRARQGRCYHLYFKEGETDSERLKLCTEYRGHLTVGAQPLTPLGGGSSHPRNLLLPLRLQLHTHKTSRAEGNRGDPLSPPGRFNRWEDEAQLSSRAAEPPGASRVRERRAACGLRAPRPGPARARCSASARTERRLLCGSPREAPQVPERQPPGARAAPSSGPRASRGRERNNFALSLREPAASYLSEGFPGRSPTAARAAGAGAEAQPSGAEPSGGARTAARPGGGRRRGEPRPGADSCGLLRAGAVT